MRDLQMLSRQSLLDVRVLPRGGRNNSRNTNRTRVCLQDHVWPASWVSKCQDTACSATLSTPPPGWRVMEKVINSTLILGKKHFTTGI